jgi:hypothetical protein
VDEMRVQLPLGAAVAATAILIAFAAGMMGLVALGASTETSRTMAALDWLRLDTTTEYDPRVVEALAKVAGRRYRTRR